MLPFSVWTIPVLVQVLQHPIICENTLTLSSALHLSMDSIQHVYLLSISDYGHTQSRYHMFSFPCHTFVSFIPHATSYYSTCYFQIFHMLIALHYPLCFIPSVYKLRVSILYFSSFEYQTSSPTFLTSPQKSNLSIQNQGHIGDRWHNTYIEA